MYSESVAERYGLRAHCHLKVTDGVFFVSPRCLRFQFKRVIGSGWMGLLIDGEWHDQWYDTDATDGRFVRSESQFRNWITATGDPGPTGDGGFSAGRGRYHLYVSHACPWAHRVMIYRSLKGLEDMVTVSVVNWVMRDRGWTFMAGPGVVPDPVHGVDFLYELYRHADPKYSGRVTVTLLWDRKTNRIVSNES